MRSVIGRSIDRSAFVWFGLFPKIVGYDESKIQIKPSIQFEHILLEVTYNGELLFYFYTWEGNQAEPEDNLYEWYKLYLDERAKQHAGKT